MPYYKVFCTICGKSHPNRAVCPLVASQSASQRRESGLTADNYRQDRLQKDKEDKEKLNREVERQLQKDERTWTRQPRRPSDAGSVASDSASSVPGSTPSECWSVSTAATLTQDEEMQARKLEARLRKLDSLQERKAEGKYPLTKAEESELRTGKLEIDFAPVMVKLQNGIQRCRLDTDPLTRDEEKQVRSAEERLRAIKRLQDRKAKGEWLEWWEMAELNRKQAIESSELMRRVRKGAPRCDLDRVPQRAPVPAPKAPPAPAQACAPVSKASPAPSQVSAPVPLATLALPASSVHAEQDDAMSSAVSTKPQEPSLKDMVATIRDQLEIGDAFTTPAQIIAEANRQLDMPATGSLRQQARSLLSEVA